MTSDLTINGVKASTYGVTFEHPTLENLLSYADLKTAIVNTSRHSNGSSIDARNAKVKSREVQLNFIIQGTSEEDYINKHLALEALLRSGKDSSGITELGAGVFLWRLRFENCESLRIFAGLNKGSYSVTFTEPDPTNRFLA